MISLFGKNEPEPTFLEKLKKSVSKTKAALSETVDTIFLGERGLGLADGLLQLLKKRRLRLVFSKQGDHTVASYLSGAT